MKDAALDAYEDACLNAVADLVFSQSEDASGRLITIQMRERYRGKTANVTLYDELWRSKEGRQDTGHELGLVLAKLVNQHDEDLFRGKEVIELSSTEALHAETDERVLRITYGTKTSYGSIRGLDAKDQMIYAGFKDGHAAKRAEYDKKAAKEERERERRRAAYEAEQEAAREERAKVYREAEDRKREAERAAMHAEQEHLIQLQASKEAKYANDDGFGVF